MMFALRQLIEKHWEFNHPLYVAFLDLEERKRSTGYR